MLMFSSPLFRALHSSNQFGFDFLISVHQIFAVVFNAIVGPFPIHPARRSTLWAFTRWARKMAASALWVQTITIIATIATIPPFFVVDILGARCWHMIVAFASQLTTFTSRFLRVKVEQKLRAFNQFSDTFLGHWIQWLYILFTDDGKSVAKTPWWRWIRVINFDGLFEKLLISVHRVQLK